MVSVGQGTAADVTTTRPIRVLVVDDEEIIRVLLTEILTEEGYEVSTASDGTEAVNVLEEGGEGHFDLIIADMGMPGKSGIEVLQAAFRVDPHYPVIMITGFPSVDTAVKLVNLGAADYITKPFNVDLIKVTVAKVLEMRKSRGLGQQTETSATIGAIDGVTQACNAILFSQLFENEIGRSKLRNHECALLVAEIDNFEKYRDNGGQAASDEVVRAFAKVLRDESRPGDIVGRLDSGEMAILLPETTRDEANTLAQKVKQSASWNFTMSGGIACFPRDASDTETLLNTARAGAQASKSQGGDVILLPR